MIKTFKVNIAGKEYNLKGENETILISAAEMVEQKINDLKMQYQGEPISTISILAALNIAEQLFSNKSQFESEKEYFLNELNKMADFLNNNLINL